MRVVLATFSLVLLLALAAGCTDPLQGTCVGDFDYIHEPQIIPDPSPFIMCAKSPGSKTYGNFLIHNCGNLALVIDDFEISDDGSGVFSELEIPETTINPGEQTAARFTYIAADTEEHRAEIVIKSNDPNYGTFSFDVVVRADEPFDGGFCPPVGGTPDAGPEDS